MRQAVFIGMVWAYRMNDSSPNAYETAISPNSNDGSSPNAICWYPNALGSCVACTLGTVISGFLIHFLDPFFPFAQLPELGISPSSELVQKHVSAQRAFWSSNYAFDFALIGLCVGVSLGLITTKQRRIAAGSAGALGGLLGGLLAGYFLGFAVAKNILESVDQSLVRSTAYHSAAWAAMLVGLVFAIALVQNGIGRALNALPVGLLVGLVVASVYNIVSSVCFSAGNLSQLIPSSIVEQVFWVAVCSITSGLGLYFGLRPRAAARSA